MKVLIFDFDGTLTKKDHNIWRELWNYLGYPTDKTSPYAKLYVSHVLKKEITRKEWFDKTCEYFMAKGFSTKHLFNVSKNIEKINGLEETLKILKNNGYQLHILSGGLRECIYYALGDLTKYFTHIESNRCKFDGNGNIVSLLPTDYDYEGKLKYVEILKRHGINAKDIIFVGNGDNDEWVIQSGCKTLCINPTTTDGNNKNFWHNSIQNVDNLTKILPYILEGKQEHKVIAEVFDLK